VYFTAEYIHVFANSAFCYFAYFISLDVHLLQTAPTSSHTQDTAMQRGSLNIQHVIEECFEYVSALTYISFYITVHFTVNIQLGIY
jgi:hypothetical protein